MLPRLRNPVSTKSRNPDRDEYALVGRKNDRLSVDFGRIPFELDPRITAAYASGMANGGPESGVRGSREERVDK